jgi:hypothetical protein
VCRCDKGRWISGFPHRPAERGGAGSSHRQPGRARACWRCCQWWRRSPWRPQSPRAGGSRPGRPSRPAPAWSSRCRCPMSTRLRWARVPTHRPSRWRYHGQQAGAADPAGTSRTNSRPAASSAGRPMPGLGWQDDHGHRAAGQRQRDAAGLRVASLAGTRPPRAASRVHLQWGCGSAAAAGNRLLHAAWASSARIRRSIATCTRRRPAQAGARATRFRCRNWLRGVR